MKIWTKLLALVVVFGLAGVSEAKEKKEKAVRGKITAIDLDAKTITIDSTTKKKPGEAHTYKLVGTVVSIDGAIKDIKDLQVNQLASVKATGDTANSITATSGKGGKKKKAA